MTRLARLICLASALGAIIANERGMTLLAAELGALAIAVAALLLAGGDK